MNPDLQIFLEAWTGGADVSEAERQRVLERLEQDSVFRAECVDEIRMLGMIKAVQAAQPRWLELHDALGLSTAALEDSPANDIASRVLQLVHAQPQSRVKARWFSWRPLTMAAAGLVFGLLSASMVFGFVGRSLEKVVSLLQESFESGPAPLITGMPQELNLWGGDFSEIVGAQQGVKPKDGSKMLRLLRSDFEGKTSSKPTRQADLTRVVDVRPFLREADGGEVVVTLSALFNAAPFPDAEHYEGVVTLWALGPRFPTEENLMDDALAHSVGLCRPLDRDVNTWQNATTRLLLPPGTEMVLLKVSFSPMAASGDSLSPAPDHVTFAGHFVDDMRASVSIRKAATNRRSVEKKLTSNVREARIIASNPTDKQVVRIEMSAAGNSQGPLPLSATTANEKRLTP